MGMISNEKILEILKTECKAEEIFSTIYGQFKDQTEWRLWFSNAFKKFIVKEKEKNSQEFKISYDGTYTECLRYILRKHKEKK